MAIVANLGNQVASLEVANNYDICCVNDPGTVVLIWPYVAYEH